MAIIKCPNCNEDISDKALKCVHCGYELQMSKRVCKECGATIRKNGKICSKCGCPVDYSENKQSQNDELKEVKNISSKKKIIIGIISFVVIVFLVLAVILLLEYSEEKQERKANKKYKEDLNTITYKMMTGSAQAEKCGNQIKKVWSNTIWEKSDVETDKYTKKYGIFNDDFNDSLTSLFSDSNFIELKDDVEANQNEINRLMRNMKNPPDDLEDAYDDLKDFYEDYLTLTNLCLKPTGSLQTYSAKFNEADSDVLNEYNKMKTYLDY